MQSLTASPCTVGTAVPSQLHDLPSTPSSYKGIADEQRRQEQQTSPSVTAAAAPACEAAGQQAIAPVELDSHTTAIPAHQHGTASAAGTLGPDKHQARSFCDPPGAAAAAGTACGVVGAFGLPGAITAPCSPSTLQHMHLASPLRAAAAAPKVQLNSLLLVASRLAGTSSSLAGCPGGSGSGSGSPLLPSTQATLEATTASVVAAEALAAALAGKGGGSYVNAWAGLAASSAAPAATPAVVAQPSVEAAGLEQTVAGSAAEALVPPFFSPPAAAGSGSLVADLERVACDSQAAVAGAHAPKPQQELPSWLCSSSADLAASAAVCRASLLSTTAALARLSQKPIRLPAMLPPQQQQTPDQAGTAQAGGVVQLPVLAGTAWGTGFAAQSTVGARMSGGMGSMVVGVPMAGGIVTGLPVSGQQQQQLVLVGAAAAAGAGVRGPPGMLDRLFDFGAADACKAGQLRVAKLQLPVACDDQQQGLHCYDASSCSSTPRAANAQSYAAAQAAAGAAAEEVSAKLLSSGQTRRRCCWEPAEEWEQQPPEDEAAENGEMVEVASPEMRITAPAADEMGAAACQLPEAQQGRHTSAGDGAVGLVGGPDTAECAVVVVVDVAPAKSKCNSKDQQRKVADVTTGSTSSLVNPVKLLAYE